MQSAEKHFHTPTKIIRWIVFAVIILVPFHAFFTTWLGSNTGGLLIVRSWKEVLIFCAVITATWLLVKDRSLRQHLLSQSLNKFIAIFALYLLLVTLLFVRDPDALALGLVIQLRLYVIFILAQIVAYYKRPPRRFLYLLILLPATVVVIFGLLQLFVLPVDFLRHFGYQKQLTIPPFFTIDDQLSKVRIASTLRGPNPLGVYLILPTTLLCMLLYTKAKQALQKDHKSTTVLTTASGLLLLGSLIVLYGSQSRSAWLGLCASIATMVFITVRAKTRYLLLGVSVVLLLGLGVSIYQWRSTQFVQDIVLHDNPLEGGETSSNQGHIRSLRDAAKDIKTRPFFGCGAGCAGPASVHNAAGAKIAENYFAQTAQESGIIGLTLLLMICGLIMARLINASDPLSVVMLSTFIGIGVASLLSHAWADDTIAYLWWGIAGLIITQHKKSTKQSDH